MKFLKYVSRLLNFLNRHTLCIVISLGACLGSTFVFMVLFSQSFLVLPLFKDPANLVWIRSDMLSQKINPELMREIDRDEGLFREFGAYSRGYWISMNVASRGDILVNVSLATYDLFDVLGVSAYLGRSFDEKDGVSGTETAIILSYDAWSRVFDKDASCINEIYKLNGNSVRLIGVLKPDFKGPSGTDSFDVYVPVSHYLKVTSESFETNINAHSMTGIARVSPSESLLNITKKIDGLFASYIKVHPEKFEIHPRLYGWLSDKLHQRKDLVRLYSILGGVSLALLLIAVCNAFALVTMRVYQRRQEMLVRLALGASYHHLFRQFLKEAFLFVFFISIFAFISSRLIFSGLHVFLPEVLFEVGKVSGRSYLLLVAGIFFLIIPAFPLTSLLFASKLRLGEIRSAGRSVTSRFRVLSILTVVQVGVTLVLIVFSVLFWRSARLVESLDLGYNADNIVAVNYGFDHLKLPVESYSSLRDSVESFMDGLAFVEKAVSGEINFLYKMPTAPVYFENGVETLFPKEEVKVANIYRVGSGFIELMEIPLLKGRSFKATDDSLNSEMVVIINKAFADKYFIGGDALGKRIKISKDEEVFYRIIGITENFYTALDENQFPCLFLNANQGLIPYGSIVVRVRNSVGVAKLEIEKLLKDEFKHLGGLYVIYTSAEALKEILNPVRSASALALLFAFLAVILAAGGLSVVFAFIGISKRRDYAIHASVGASPLRIFLLVSRQFFGLCFLGIILGVGGAVFLTPFAVNSLVGIDVYDFVSFLCATLLILLIGAAITVFTGMRTLRINLARELLE